MKIRKLFLFALIGLLPLCSCGSKLDFSLDLKSYDELKSNIKEYKNEISKEEYEEKTSKYKDFFDLDTSKSFNAAYIVSSDGFNSIFASEWSFVEQQCQIINCDAKNESIKDSVKTLNIRKPVGEEEKIAKQLIKLETKKDKEGNFITYDLINDELIERFENWDSLYFEARSFFELEFSSIHSGSECTLYYDDGVFTQIYSSNSVHQFTISDDSFEYYNIRDLDSIDFSRREIICYRFQFN